MPEYYSVTADRARPGGVWSFAFTNDEEAAQFAAMVTGASFAIYRGTGNHVGFSGCEGFRLFVFEGKDEKYELKAVYCNGKALSQDHWD